MKKILTVICLLFVSSVIFAQMPGMYKPPVVFKWLDKLEDGKKSAKEKSKPLLVFYYLDGDKDSDWFLKIGFEDKQVKETLKDFVGVKINATKEKRIFNTYPTILFYSPAGKELLMERIVSRMEAWEINNSLNMVTNKTTYITNEKFEKFVSLPRKQFSSGEKISFKCKALERGYSTVKVMDLKGNLVKFLFRGVKKGDETFNVDWDQKDLKGVQVKAGEYLFVVELASYKDILEVTIL